MECHTYGYANMCAALLYCTYSMMSHVVRRRLAWWTTSTIVWPQWAHRKRMSYLNITSDCSLKFKITKKSYGTCLYNALLVNRGSAILSAPAFEENQRIGNLAWLQRPRSRQASLGTFTGGYHLSANRSTLLRTEGLGVPAMWTFEQKSLTIASPEHPAPFKRLNVLPHWSTTDAIIRCGSKMCTPAKAK
jgi:hypothetical protein